ncbi:MAG: DNA mismatch repair endonuclease MutL [Phycisphaerae bacterium]
MTTILPRKRIHRLPDALINKIAAGEVVERPASVVKELLENSIDAGARRLVIAVEDGGRTLIRISDDGHGIPPEEAPLAFAQHATSKIQESEDLFAIRTMGFRGEALASIASVSHAVMTTRTEDSPHGIRIEVRDSQVSPAMPAAAPVGTTLEVRDLFYSVPARRKFLRTDATEFSHIHEMVLRSALPHPEIAFSLSHNGRNVLELPVTGDHRMRVAEALVGDGGKELYGQLIPVDFSERGVRVTGFAGQPSLARPTAKYQYLFLNGRYIRDRSLLHALKEAYRGLIEPSSQPVAILFIEMEPTLFDVNVHPQKTEVRFRDSGSVYRPVLAAIREKLLASDLTPGVRTAGRVDGEGSGDWGLGSVGRRGDAGNGAGLSRPGMAETRQIIAEFFKQSEPVQPRLHFGVETGPSPIEDPSRITFDSGREANSSGSGVRDSGAVPGENSASRAEPEPRTPEPEQISPAKPIRFLQTHNTYIVAETSEGILIIDQHALHERIIYEELLARAMRGPLEGQRLLIPEILPISPRHAAALERVRGLLEKLGMEITDFDAQSIAVHSFPSLLSKVSPREFLRELLDKLLEVGSKLTPEELLHEVLDMASCKAAVKAGYPLSSEEIAALLARKEQVDRSSNCPHGRPTTLRLTISDLERQFKRK